MRHKDARLSLCHDKGGVMKMAKLLKNIIRLLKTDTKTTPAQNDLDNDIYIRRENIHNRMLKDKWVVR